MSMVINSECEIAENGISYIKSTHGQMQLIYNQGRYCIKQKNLKSILWRCVKTNCSASITISENETIIRINDLHNHFIESMDIPLLKLRHELKQQAQNTSVAIDKIVEDAYCNIIVHQNITDALPKLPNIKTLKNTVGKQRRQVRPPLPTTIQQLPNPLPSNYTMTKFNQNFLMYDGDLHDQRTLIFSSKSDLQFLSTQRFWYCDGTFYITPSIFYQIYSIHAYEDGFSTPCVYALLQNKSEPTYQDLFKILMEKMREICDNIRLECVTIDFENAVKNVFDKNYPNVRVKGCLFHYGQALFRKFVDLGLSSSFKSDEALRNWFRSFAALSFLPETEVDGAKANLYSNKPTSYEKELNLFLKYHINTYGEQSCFPPAMYNHYRNTNPRTINYLEGRHNRLKKRSCKAHQDIYSCIDLLKNEQLLSADDKQRIETGEAPPKRRKKSRDAEQALYRLWEKLDKKQISTEKFLKAAGLRYFQHLDIE